MAASEIDGSPDSPKFDNRGYTSAAIAYDLAGNVTVRVPVYAAGHPIFVLVVTAVLGGFGWFFVSELPGGPATWYAVPIVLECAYIWLIACFAYKTSVVHHDGTYDQRVTFLPRLVRPTGGPSAICFGNVVTFGRYGRTELYPVRVRFSDASAYDLVVNAGTLEAAKALAAQLAEATHLPLEPQIARGAMSGGMAKLAVITVVLCVFPIFYFIAVTATVPRPREPVLPLPVLHVSVDAKALTVDAADFAPPYEVSPKRQGYVDLPFDVTQLGAHRWRIAIPTSGFGAKGYDEIRIQGQDDDGNEKVRLVKLQSGTATVEPTRAPAPSNSLRS